MNATTRLACMLLALLLVPCLCLAAAQPEDLAPVPRPDGGKWRIGYMEGGQYPDFRQTLEAILQGLERRGWLHVDLSQAPEEPGEHEALWRWLADNVQSDYIEIAPDGFFAPGDFDSSRRPETREQALTRLKQGDIDLMLAMGTWAGQDLASIEHNVPVVVAAASDPVAAGIVPPPGGKGLPHVHATLQPGSYERQVRLFHDMAHFTRLGMVYEDSAEGRTFAALDAVNTVAAQEGFEVVSCFAPFNDVPQQEAERRALACYEELAAAADAVYVTTHRGVTPATLPTLLAPLVRHGLPTFSMQGPGDVRHGVLASMAREGFAAEGQFHADAIARILHGASPRDLDMILETPPTLALNLMTAETIGFDPPVDILMAADVIFEEALVRGAPVEAESSENVSSEAIPSPEEE